MTFLYFILALPILTVLSYNAGFALGQYFFGAPKL